MWYRYMCTAKVKRQRDFAYESDRTYLLMVICSNPMEAETKFIEHITSKERVATISELMCSIYINEIDKIYDLPKPKKKKP